MGCLRIYHNTKDMVGFWRQTVEERVRRTATRLYTGHNGVLSTKPETNLRESLKQKLAPYLTDTKIRDICIELAA